MLDKAGLLCHDAETTPPNPLVGREKWIVFLPPNNRIELTPQVID
jgi:hypothetical protein